MSRVRNREELLDEIGLLVDEYIEYILKKRKRKKLKKAEKESADGESGSGGDGESQAPTVVKVVKSDPRCLAILKSKKQCTRDKKGSEATEDEDPDLCKLHNNPKFKGKLDKMTPSTPAEVNNTSASSGSAEQSSSDESSSEDDEDLIEVNITVDTQGNHVDQHGNVWDLEKKLIIGKKDPKTKEVIIHKRI